MSAERRGEERSRIEWNRVGKSSSIYHKLTRTRNSYKVSPFNTLLAIPYDTVLTIELLKAICGSASQHLKTRLRPSNFSSWVTSSLSTPL